MSTPVAILGMHRSGTSMIAQLLHHCGLHLGSRTDLIAANKDNEAGYWEHLAFTRLNETILQTAGGSWNQPPVLESDWSSAPAFAPLRQTATQLIEGLAIHSFWGWKDPRTSLTLPFWLNLLPDLRLVVCLRHPFEVAHSLSTRHDHWLAYETGLTLWLDYYQAIRRVAPPDRLIVTHYASMFTDAAAELHRLTQFLALPVSQTQLETACQQAAPGLQRHFAPPQTTLPPEIQTEYEHWCAQAGPIFQARQTLLAQHPPGEEALTLAYRQIETIRQRHEETRQALTQARTQIEHLETELRQEQEQSAWLRLTLADVADAPGWPVVHKAKQWAENHLTVGSRRFRLYRLMWRGLETVVVDGIGATLARSWDWMRGKKPAAAPIPPLTVCTISARPTPEQINQTYHSLQQQGDIPWRWLIVHSTDMSEWPGHWRQDSRVSLYAAATPDHLYQQANTLLAQAQPALFIFLPPGDRLPPQAFSTIRQLFQTDPTGEALTWPTNKPVPPHEPLTAQFASSLMVGRGIVRGELLAKVGYFAADKGAAAFWDLTMRLMDLRPRLLEIRTEG